MNKQQYKDRAAHFDQDKQPDSLLLKSPSVDSGTLFVKPPNVQQPIDIVVPCHNRLELTITCVNALYSNTKAPFHLIVVDDSTDKITRLYWKEMKKKLNNITYIYSREPYKEGNQYLNIAFSYAKHPYIACVGNSIKVEPEWEIAALDILGKDPAIGVLGFKNLFIFDPPGDGNIESAGISMVDYTPVDIGRDLCSHRMSAIYECMAVQWAFCMVRKEAVVDKEGKPNLPEGVYNGFKGWDDIDNCFVLRRRGWKVVYNGYGVGYHYPRATRGIRPENKEGQNLNRENARRFYKRWGYWEQFTKDYPKAPDGNDWAEAKEGAVIMP